MSPEFYNKFLHILLHISHSLRPTPFWDNFNFWIGLANVAVLSITLYWLVRYTRAAEIMTENQMTPAVDVNMIFDKEVKQTYFWFWNSSNIPAKVSLKVKTKKKEYDINPLRIPPNKLPLVHLLKTASHYDFLEGEMTDGFELTLCISVKPAVDNTNIKVNFTKSYRFNSQNLEWNESSWVYPDPPFPN